MQSQQLTEVLGDLNLMRREKRDEEQKRRIQYIKQIDRRLGNAEQGSEETKVGGAGKGVKVRSRKS